ncbi:MAG: HAD family hydrolase [Dehalococcoidia bacterium]|nr:HAD family hydrolase [Dehalococcoidia bacterium]
MTVSAVFFDMDDTLLDGFTAMEASWTLVCGEASPALGVDPEHLRKAIRREAMEFWKDEAKMEHWRIRLDDARTEIIRRALEAEGLDEARADRMSHDYAAAHRENLLLFDDAIETLERLRDSGRRVGLLTNGPATMQRDKITRFELERHFDVIVVEGEFGHGKPHPEVFRHALESVGARPEEAWHIGDNLYADVGGARSAGLRAAWIHRERLKLEESTGVKPDAAIAHLHEIDEALGLNGHS